MVFNVLVLRTINTMDCRACLGSWYCCALPSQQITTGQVPPGLLIPSPYGRAEDQPSWEVSPLMGLPFYFHLISTAVTTLAPIGSAPAGDWDSTNQLCALSSCFTVLGRSFFAFWSPFLVASYPLLFHLIITQNCQGIVRHFLNTCLSLVNFTKFSSRTSKKYQICSEQKNWKNCSK
jgi:hypothetical protein